MTTSIVFRLVSFGTASSLTLGLPDGEFEEPDHTLWDMPA